MHCDAERTYAPSFPRQQGASGNPPWNYEKGNPWHCSCFVLASLFLGTMLTMTQPTALSVMRNRAAVAEELRRLLPRMEGFRTAKTFPFGLSAVDHCLPQGGLACGALHEVVPEAGATPAAFGFIVALLTCLSSPPPCGEGLGWGSGGFALASTIGPYLTTPLPTLPQGGGKRSFLFSRPMGCGITAVPTAMVSAPSASIRAE